MSWCSRVGPVQLALHVCDHAGAELGEGRIEHVGHAWLLRARRAENLRGRAECVADDAHHPPLTNQRRSTRRDTYAVAQIAGGMIRQSRDPRVQKLAVQIHQITVEVGSARVGAVLEALLPKKRRGDVPGVVPSSLTHLHAGRLAAPVAPAPRGTRERGQDGLRDLRVDQTSTVPGWRPSAHSGPCRFGSPRCCSSSTSRGERGRPVVPAPSGSYSAH